ncbi:MAG: conjugative transfer signal peptidase TraF [Pseudomonadota bacterium]|nr:conjugative transfer signal peptidase TraF [Pseudomonadota bacterium]
MTPLILAAAVGVFVGTFYALGLRINATESLPLGIYRTTAGPVARGTLVAACLPENLARAGLERGWLRPGDCPGDVAPVLKEVVALPGDFVMVSDEGLIVNGGRIPRTARVAADSAGRPVEAIPTGFYRVGFGEVWLIANANPRSWDSRYYGPIPIENIRTPMRLLITWSR